jgi:Spy/CpxP family protein refolding chaperone
MKKQITAALIAASMAMSATAFAQQQPGNTPGQPSAPQAAPAAPATDFRDDDLEKFAEVQKPLQEIRTDYSKRLQSTQQPEQAAKLQQEATDKMMEVIEDSGLEVATYNQIAVALQSNPELQAKVKSMMN